jgi:hypothetical protein
MMPIRFQIWRVRRRTRIFSKYSKLTLVATVNHIVVGQFRNGREVR